MSGNKDDWISFIEKEDGEMFAVNLVEDIIKNSRRVLFEKQIDAQILPYTVNYAKNLLMDMVNVRENYGIDWPSSNASIITFKEILEM